MRVGEQARVRVAQGVHQGLGEQGAARLARATGPNPAAMMGVVPGHRRGIAAGARVMLQNTGAGISIAFVLAIGLGVVRKYTNTTTSSLCHTTYNLLGGIGLSGAALGVGAGVDVVLIALSAYGIWSSRRRREDSLAGAP